MDTVLKDTWVYLDSMSRWIPVQLAMLWGLDGGSVWMFYRLASRCTLTCIHHGCPARNLLMPSDSKEMDHYGCPTGESMVHSDSE